MFLLVKIYFLHQEPVDEETENLHQQFHDLGISVKPAPVEVKRFEDYVLINTDHVIRINPIEGKPYKTVIWIQEIDPIITFNSTTSFEEILEQMHWGFKIVNRFKKFWKLLWTPNYKTRKIPTPQWKG